MHKYLRAIGFSKVRDKAHLLALLKQTINLADTKEYTSQPDTELLFADYRKSYGPGIGLAVRGEVDENDQLLYDYYFPYIQPEYVSSGADISVERHVEKESYAGVCDEAKVGVSLIFYLQNVVTYLKYRNSGLLPVKGTSLMLSGLSVDGTVMMPLYKDASEVSTMKRTSANRKKWIAQARQGDETAMENLALADMDTYSSISKRIHREDVYSLVDTYFMPYGVECDLYSVLGEITELRELTNTLSGEQLVAMTLNCNELVFNICINKTDLMGEPAVGRRFKGTVWLQGYINYPNE